MKTEAVKKTYSLLHIIVASQGWIIALSLFSISLAVSAFTSEKYYDNAFTTVCYIYIGPIEFNADDIKNEDNWYPVSEGIMPYICQSSGYLGGICYNDEGQYATLQLALNDLASTGEGGGGLTDRNALGSIDGYTFPNTTLILYQFDLP